MSEHTLPCQAMAYACTSKHTHTHTHTVHIHIVAHHVTCTPHVRDSSVTHLSTVLHQERYPEQLKHKPGPKQVPCGRVPEDGSCIAELQRRRRSPSSSTWCLGSVFVGSVPASRVLSEFPSGQGNGRKRSPDGGRDTQQFQFVHSAKSAAMTKHPVGSLLPYNSAAFEKRKWRGTATRRPPMI